MSEHSLYTAPNLAPLTPKVHSLTQMGTERRARWTLDTVDTVDAVTERLKGNVL